MNKILLILIVFLGGCSDGKDDNETDSQKGEIDNIWRYFDREVYFPTGVSVQPEVAAAQDIIQTSLILLEKQTDLGADYFIFKSEEDSLLQPVDEETHYDGRPWYSFIQIWNDELFNDFQITKVGTTGDEDVIVALNEHNPQEYYIIFRESCFIAGATCGYPTQEQSRAIVWRAFGYLIGLKDGDNSNSYIMKSGLSPKQTDETEVKKYLAEFDGQLERIRNDLPNNFNGK